MPRDPRLPRLLTPDARVDSEQVYRFRITATLTPGGSATANMVVYKQNDGEFFDTSASETIYDFHDHDSLGDGNPYGVNYGLTGEVFKCRYNPEHSQFEIISSQGLNRFGKTDADVSAGGSVAVSLYHSQSSPSCSGSDSGVNVTACAKVDIDSGTDVELVYHPEFKNWFIISAPSSTSSAFSTTVRVKATAFFGPGDTGATMDLLQWNSGTEAWDDSGVNVTCGNTGKDCCMIDDEENWAVKVDSDDYELMPFGLFRRAQTTAAIDIGSTGIVNLIDHSGGTCAGSENTTAHSVTVCNGDATNNGFRKLFDDEEIWIKHFENKWHVVSVPRVLLAGKPTAQLQSGSTGTFDVYYLNSSGTWTAWASNTVSARNNTGMTFETSELYSITYHENGDLANAFPLNIEVY